MNYLVKQINGTFAVWLAERNRYILFKEPAFRIFRLLAENKSQCEILNEITTVYDLPLSEADRFIVEIINNLKSLPYEKISKANTPFPPIKSGTSSQQQLNRTYNINGKNILINYGNSYIEEHIHPKIKHLSALTSDENPAHIYVAGISDGAYFLVIDNDLRNRFSFTLLEELAGGLYLQFLNIIHGIRPDSWMGVAHASAITDGKEAILFMAPSGGGKSTIASLMLTNGYKLLSDDFVPIALTEPEIYSFPAGISVKKAAMPVLKEFFPEIDDLNVTDRPGFNKNGVYLPFPSDSQSSLNVKARAIIFVQYDKSVKCRLKKQPKHELMNRFVSESWIANNPVAAGRFLEWYFNLDIYTLNYSDNEKAIAGIKKIFSK